MKINKLYSNMPNLFEPILFNRKLNVIIANVKRPKNQSKDSHNLGKTLLMEIIDYCLLKGSTKQSFIHRLPEELKPIKFYIEVSLPKNRFLTICRGVSNNTKISFKEHKEPEQDFSDATYWDHVKLSFEKAKEFLDGKLNLQAISPFDYRKGMSYFLRKQSDYNDVFQIDKFSRGLDANWKPYVAKLLGFSEDIIENKYKLDKEIKSVQREINSMKAKLTYTDGSIDELRAKREAEVGNIVDIESKLSSFDFKKEDFKISEEELMELESNISYINNEIYNLSADLSEINKAMEFKINFKIDYVKKIFEEVGIHLKDSIVKDYKSLENFNNQLTKDRQSRLLKQKKLVEYRILQFKNQINKLNQERKVKLELIREKDTFKKYKQMQSRLVDMKSKLKVMDHELSKLEEIKQKENKVANLEQELSESVQSSKEEIEKSNPTLTEVRRICSDFSKKVLDKTILLYVKLNKKDNIEFITSYSPETKTQKLTHEDKGDSYKKLLCVFFDLAILSYYAQQPFYHFVYHDGILEGLDNRKKLSFIETVRSYSDKHDIQYILTVIESDLPYKDGKKYHFKESEIIRRLSDDGSKGRLFNCETF